MAETNGLLNRRTDNSVPRVRISPSPPSWLGSYNRSPIALSLDAECHRTKSLERRAPHLPTGRKAMAANREVIALQDARQIAGNRGTPYATNRGQKRRNPGVLSLWSLLSHIDVWAASSRRTDFLSTHDTDFHGLISQVRDRWRHIEVSWACSVPD